MTWLLYIDAEPAPCVHEWCETTTLNSVDLQFMCIWCGVVKYEARRQEPTDVG